jgi:hypothetical protein
MWQTKFIVLDAQGDGLAGAVQAEQADPGTLLEAKQDGSQDLLVGWLSSK